jgi:dihydroorotase
VADPAAGLVIRGGRVLTGDPSEPVRVADVAIAGGVVVAIGEALDVPQGALVLDADGCLVGPGLVDLHAHLRQPGAEESETIETASRAAALGGFTAIVAMPNTTPAIDSAAVARQVLELGRGALCEVAVAGAITLDRAGERLAPMGELAELGITLFTDDGTGVQDGALMRRALDYARGLGVTLAQHCEDACIAAGGVMHEGEWSGRLGLPGAPAAAEEAMLARDLALVALTGAPMHFLHLSSAGSVELVRRAKATGLPVTAEVTPHHLFLSDEAVSGYDPVFRVNPPLRTGRDIEALKAGLADHTIDAIATDHAPHAPEAKDQPFDQAPPGMLGLETALAVAFSALHGPLEEGWQSYSAEGPRRSPQRILELLTSAPAAIARLRAGDARVGGHSAQGGPIALGAAANVCVFDPAATWRVDAAALASRSRNTPYAGRTLSGRVRHTVLRGEAVVIDAVAQR